MARASVIIRAKNEEKWIKACLEMIQAQTIKDVEVILVDNRSSDATVAVASRCGVERIVALDRYVPGHALNAGIRHSNSEFLVFLSAHCIPKDELWLERLLSGFQHGNDIAGVYGRQIPVSFSSDADKRDLLTTFGLDRRIQVKDYFFHNANSAIRRDLWEQIPFDETVTNVEDRMWAKAVIERGFRLVYEPEAVVYHHHGIHQNNEPMRARGAVSVIETIQGAEINSLPELLKPEHHHITAVLPVLGDIREVAGHNLLVELIRVVKHCRFVRSVYVLSETEQARRVAVQQAVRFIPRPSRLASTSATIEAVLQYALQEVERNGEYPDALLYANYLYPFRPVGLFDTLVHDVCYQGFDTVFTAKVTFGNYWQRVDSGTFTQIGDGLKSREFKRPLYQALYGLGCISGASTIRAGSLVGESVGILPVDDVRYTLYCKDESADALAALLLQRRYEHPVVAETRGAVRAVPVA